MLLTAILQLSRLFVWRWISRKSVSCKEVAKATSFFFALPGAEMHFGADRGEVLLVNQIDKSVHDVRFEKDRWITKKRAKPNMHRFRVN